MASNPNDLQAWLSQLKKRAEQQQGLSHEKPAPAREQPREEPPAQHEPVQAGISLSEQRRHEQAARQQEKEAERRRRMHQQQKRVEAENARLERARKQKEAEAKRLRQQAEARREQKPKQRPPVGRKKPKEQGTPRSCLGLSGNLMHDLRNNPRALREAILLVETLGRPVCDRDPTERNF